MKISLITVSYNSEETIRDTFESVKGQSIDKAKLEYILIDGNSIDKTLEIANDYSEIIDISVSEADTGIYNAMNKGLSLASGDIIGFLNSDDTFADDLFLEKVLEKFTENKNTEIVFSDINYVNHNGKIIRRWRTGVQKSFKHGWHPAHPGFYAKKNAFEEHGGFDENFRIAADFDLMLRFIEIHQLKSNYLDIVAVNMKLGGESNKSFKNISNASIEIKKSFEKYNLNPGKFYTLKRWFSKIIQRFIN